MILDYNRVKAVGDKFIEDKDNQTKAQQKESAFAKLRTEFAAATRDLREGSAEYLRVYGVPDRQGQHRQEVRRQGKVDKSGASKAPDAEAYATALAAGGKQLALIQAEAEARRPLTALEVVGRAERKRGRTFRKHGTSRLAEVKAMDAQIIAQATPDQQGKRERSTVIAAMAASDAALQTQREQETGRLIDEAESVAAQTRALKD